MMSLSVRSVTIVVALLAGLLAIGLYRQSDWAIWAWPWEDGRLVGVFLASILAAFSASLLWTVVVSEPAALEGIAMDVAAAGIGLGSVALISLVPSDRDLLPFTLGLLLIGVIALRFAVWSTRLPTTDRMPQLRLATIALAGYIVTLVIVGGGMVVGWGELFPWETPTDTRRAIGVIFLGAASYFVVGLRRRTWVHTGGQLAGFLAYDLVLVWPYIQELRNRNDGAEPGALEYNHYGAAAGGDDQVLTLNLVLYIAVLVVSAVIAGWYLAFDPRTRRHLTWTRSAGSATAAGHGAGETTIGSPIDADEG